MRSGSLTTPIEIYSLSGVANALGEIQKTDATLFCPVRCEVRYKRGMESEDNGQLTPYTTMVLTIRYLKALLEDMVILLDGKWYNIKDIAHYGKDRTVVIVEKSKVLYNIVPWGT